MDNTVDVVVYSRVSTDEQFTVSQLTEVERYCRFKGYRILRVFSDEISGSVDPLKRPGFREMLNFCQKHGVRFVVMYDLTRFYRAESPLDAMIRLREIMERYGLIFDFVAEPQVQDPLLQEFWRFIKSFIATYERHMISLRTKYGIERVREEGRLFHRPTILHYFALIYLRKPIPPNREERKRMFTKLSREELVHCARVFLLTVERYWNDPKIPKTLISQVLIENEPIFKRLYEVFPYAQRSYYAYKRAIEYAKKLIETSEQVKNNHAGSMTV